MKLSTSTSMEHGHAARQDFPVHPFIDR